jgi:hypothetical protein
MRAGTRFYVDGAQVRCPEHVEPGRERQQHQAFHIRQEATVQ